MKKIKMFMGAVLCMNLLAVSGCDRAVQSAVVDEKNPTDQNREENKETVQKTVAEQVEAPETYQTTIQADLRSADREDDSGCIGKSAGCRCDLFKKSKKGGDF